MDSATLRSLQGPLKQKCREEPPTALVQATASASLNPDDTASVPMWPWSALSKVVQAQMVCPVESGPSPELGLAHF